MVAGVGLGSVPATCSLKPSHPTTLIVQQRLANKSFAPATLTVDFTSRQCHDRMVNLSDSRTTAPQQIVRISAAEAVFAALRADIENGHLPVGAKLGSEATMAQQYGVSRSVVREALRSCMALGLTDTQTGKGTFVIATKPHGELILGQFSSRSLMEARPHIEVPAAEFAASRRSEEQLAGLKEVLDAMEGEEDPEEWVRLDAAFHAGIALASGNGVFQRVVSDIRDAMASQSETLNLITGRRAKSDAEHHRIFQAISSGNASAAAKAMAQHLAAVDHALHQIVGESTE